MLLLLNMIYSLQLPPAPPSRFLSEAGFLNLNCDIWRQMLFVMKGVLANEDVQQPSLVSGN